MRIVFRLLLAASMVTALGVAGVSLRKLGLADPSAWATVAAALAVVAAVASAWTSQRVLELPRGCPGAEPCSRNRPPAPVRTRSVSGD